MTGHIPDGSSHECRRRLKAEGAEFDEQGRANRRPYVAWDVLVERPEEQQAA